MVCSQWKLSGDGVREDRCASRSAEVEAFGCSGIGIARINSAAPSRSAQTTLLALDHLDNPKRPAICVMVRSPFSSLIRRSGDGGLLGQPKKKGWSDWILGDDEEDEVAIRRASDQKQRIFQHGPTATARVPPPPRPSETISFSKPRGASLGVRFLSEDGDQGAEIHRVDPFGMAFKLGLQWGDTIERVKTFTFKGGEEQVKLTTELRNGYDAAKALRPVCGRVEISVRKRKKTPQDASATKLQARWRGVYARMYLEDAHTAATRIACYWRRYAAIIEADELREDRHEDAHVAAIVIQSHWRRYDAYVGAYEQVLAICFLQQQIRTWLAKPRKPRPPRPQQQLPKPQPPRIGSEAATALLGKRRRTKIRKPPALVDEESADESE